MHRLYLLILLVQMAPPLPSNATCRSSVGGQWLRGVRSLRWARTPVHATHVPTGAGANRSQATTARAPTFQKLIALGPARSVEAGARYLRFFFLLLRLRNSSGSSMVMMDGPAVMLIPEFSARTAMLPWMGGAT